MGDPSCRWQKLEKGVAIFSRRTIHLRSFSIGRLTTTLPIDWWPTLSMEFVDCERASLMYDEINSKLPPSLTYKFERVETNRYVKFHVQ